MSYLQFVDDQGVRARINLEPGQLISIGRNRGCTISTTNATVSRVHGTIRYVDGRWVVEDLNSSNHTFVNDEQVTWRPLCDRDRVRCGDFEIRFFSDNVADTKPEQTPPGGGEQPASDPKVWRYVGASGLNTPSSDTPFDDDSLLAQFGQDLTAAARAGRLDPVYGREHEVIALARAITQRRKPNALLVGPPGVGKTSIVHGLAQLLVGGKQAAAMRQRRIVEVSVSGLLAGTSFRGEFEERMTTLINEVSAEPEVVLFIDEFHTIMGGGGAAGSARDAAQMLKPALASGAIRVIGATTTAEYQRHIAKDSAFTRRFTRIQVEEPEDEVAIMILRRLEPRFETHYGVSVEEEALVAAVHLSKRYLQGRYLPDKAIHLIDQACARRLVPMPGAPIGQPVDKALIVRLLAEQNRVDPALIVADPVETRSRLQELEGFLQGRILGQGDALAQVSQTLTFAYSGLRNPQAPIASFLFVGPTGVGKTETAKVLAEFLFGDRDRVLQIDMSEYSEKHSKSRLIGSPPGYIGHDEEGQLTGPMHINAQRVVLLDEIEKAHPEILMLLLQLLDEGSLTDSRGKRASYTEAVIILTSNLIRETLRPRELGFLAEQTDREPDDEDDVRQQLIGDLPPELVGRIGAVVHFDKLSASAARGIAELITQKTLRRLTAQGVELSPPDDFIDQVVASIESLDLGARAIAREVRRSIGMLLGRGAPRPVLAKPQLDRRQKYALVYLRLMQRGKAGAEALAVEARTYDGVEELQGVLCRDEALVLIFSLQRPAVVMAQELRRDERVRFGLVHRGVVHGLAGGAPRGVALELCDLLGEAFTEVSVPGLVFTAPAAEALSDTSSVTSMDTTGLELGLFAELRLFRSA